MLFMTFFDGYLIRFRWRHLKNWAITSISDRAALALSVWCDRLIVIRQILCLAPCFMLKLARLDFNGASYSNFVKMSSMRPIISTNSKLVEKLINIFQTSFGLALIKLYSLFISGSTFFAGSTKRPHRCSTFLVPKMFLFLGLIKSVINVSLEHLVGFARTVPAIDSTVKFWSMEWVFLWFWSSSPVGEHPHPTTISDGATVTNRLLTVPAKIYNRHWLIQCTSGMMRNISYDELVETNTPSQEQLCGFNSGILQFSINSTKIT